MSGIATVSFEGSSGVGVARIAGEVDSSNATEVSHELLSSVPNDARALVLDLTETSYIDSSGISLIFDLAGRLRNRRQELRLVVPQRSFVAEVLRTVSLDGVAPVDGSLSEALRAVRPNAPEDES